MATTFDGPNLRIIIDAADLEVDVERDWYSEWKQFVLVGDNAKFPPAFRTVGGDELTPGIEAGAYFFLQNQLGWRIRPAEADATILVIGNLAPEDSSLPMTVPTTGGFTVLLNGLQPITQSVESIFLAQQDSIYNGEVWIDLAAGAPGTDFPIGTSSAPVDNVIDAFTISTRLSVRKFVIVNSVVVLSRDAVNWVFEGRGAQPSLDVNDFDVSGSEFKRCSPIGDLINSAGPVRFTEARLVDVTNFQGLAESCGLSSLVSLKAGTSTFVRCYSQVIGINTPIIDCNDFAVDLSLRSYDGGIAIRNFSQAGNDCSIDANAARIILESTVSDGTIEARGVGEIEDSSTGTVVLNTDGFIDATVDHLDQILQAVYIDTVNGVAGLDSNIGTPINPVNNVTDARTLADNKGIIKFVVVNGTITLDQNYDIWEFDSAGFRGTVDINGQSISGAVFREINVSGAGTGINEVSCFDCEITDLSGVDLFLVECGLTGTITVPTGGTVKTRNCVTDNLETNPAVFTMVTGGGVLVIRGHAGPIRVENMSQNSHMASIDLVGDIELASNNTMGNVVLHGTGRVIDLTTDTVVVVNETINPDDVLLTRKIVQNRQVVDQTTQNMLIYDDNETDVILAGDVFEDAAETIPYRGRGIEHRRGLDTVAAFTDDFSEDFA